MKLSLILEAVDRASRPLDRFRSDVDRAGRSSRTAGTAIGAMGRHMERTERSARGLGRAGETMGARIAAGARMGSAALVGLERRMQLSSATMTALAVKGAGLLGGAIRGGVLTAGAAGGALAAGGLYKVFSAGTQAETLKTQLVQSRNGDVRAAERDLAWITDFAAKTPYDLAQVTEAFAAARGAGVDPMNGSLMALGDAASALGKTYSEAIGMIMDAQQGEFSRLPEFQIKGSQKDGKATFRYFDRSGKEMVKSVKMAGHNVERAITEILNEKFGGGMDAISKTTAGKWANLTDKITQSAVKVWNGGFGAEVQRQLDRATQAFERAEKDGKVDHWANRTSQALGRVVKRIGEANWDGFERDISGIGDSFEKLYNIASKVSEVLGEVRKGLGDMETGADNYIGGLGWGPNGLEYQAPAWMKNLGEWNPFGASPNPLPFKDQKAKDQAGKLKWHNPNEVPFMDGRATKDDVWRDAVGKRNRVVPPPLLNKPAKPAQAQTAKVALHVTADRGLSVRPTKIAATGGLAAEVNTGRAMGTFA